MNTASTADNEYVSRVEVRFETHSGYASRTKTYTYLADFIPEVGSKQVVSVSGDLKIVKVIDVERVLRSEMDDGTWKWMIECNLERHAYLTKRSMDNQKLYEVRRRKMSLQDTIKRAQEQLDLLKTEFGGI